MPTQQRCPALSYVPCPVSHVPSRILPSPVGVNWWLLVLAWDNWSTWSINVYMHILGISGKMSHLSHPIPSCPIPSCMGQMVAIGAGLGQMVHMVHQCIHAYIGHLRQDVPLVPSHPIPSHPVWAKWWLLVLGWDKWSTWSINVYMHMLGISGKMSHLSHPILSHPVPSHPLPSHLILYGPNGGYWCWAGTNGPHGPSMYTCIYWASQARCPTCPIPSYPILSHPIPSHPMPSHPVWAKWWLLVLAWDNWSTWSINVYMHIWACLMKACKLVLLP